MAIMQILFYFFKYKNPSINYKLLKFRTSLCLQLSRKTIVFKLPLSAFNSSIYRASEACEISVNRTILLHTQAAHSEVPCQW